MTQWRVDADNGNAFSAWQAMGSPQSPDEKQYKVLEAASIRSPRAWPAPIAVAAGSAELDFTLPRQGVSLLIVE